MSVGDSFLHVNEQYNGEVSPMRVAYEAAGMMDCSYILMSSYRASFIFLGLRAVMHLEKNCRKQQRV